MFGVLFANPFDSPEQYDFLNVAGVISPGLFKADGGSRPYKWDTKDSAGTQGATQTYRGLRPSDDLKGKFCFWTRAQVQEFYDSFVALLHYDATKANPKPIDVLYPSWAANGITSLITEKVGPLKHEDGKQLWTVDVEFSEYRPAAKKNATSTPTGTQTTSGNKGATGTGNKPTAQDAQDIEIEKLTNKAKTPL